MIVAAAPPRTGRHVRVLHFLWSGLVKPFERRDYRAVLLGSPAPFPGLPPHPLFGGDEYVSAASCQPIVVLFPVLFSLLPAYPRYAGGEHV